MTLRNQTLGLIFGLLAAVFAYPPGVYADEAESAAAPAPGEPSAEWSRSLCDAIAESVQILEAHHLVGDPGEAGATLVESLLRAVEPSVTFMSEDEVSAGDAAPPEGDWHSVETLPVRMGLITLRGLYPGAAAAVDAALAELAPDAVFGLILDLRGAGGTAADDAAAIAARFVKANAPLYSLLNRNDDELDVVRAPKAKAEPRPVMVLVDEGTTLAAELLAAVMRDSVQGAMLIGRPTSGNPMVREPVRLSTGRYALLATRQVQTAGGGLYDGTAGIAPNILITDIALDEILYEPETPVLRKGKTQSEEEVEDRALRDRTREDAYLRRATDVLLGLKALGLAGR